MIEYKAPSGGSSLLYPIQQVTLSISNIRLQKLNTSPWQLLPSGFKYCVFSTILDYDNININSGQDMWIGHESLLAGSISFANQSRISTTTMGAQSGTMSIGTNENVAWYANAITTEPLVLYQQTDDSSAVFNYFNLTITYIKLP